MQEAMTTREDLRRGTRARTVRKGRRKLDNADYHSRSFASANTHRRQHLSDCRTGMTAAGMALSLMATWFRACSRSACVSLPALFLLLGACASSGRPLPDVAAEVNATLYTAPFEIGPGDAIEIRFPNRSDWNQTVRIRPDGRATFPFLEEIAAAGNTLAQLDEKLTRAYAKVLQDPDVVLNLATIAPRHVIVMGEVHEPGEIVLEGGRMSLIEAIGRAGGPLKETALLENTLLVRWLPQENRQISWRIDASVDQWGAPVPLLLQPYDVVFVPNTPIDNVDIWVDQYIRRLIPFPYLPIMGQ